MIPNPENNKFRDLVRSLGPESKRKTSVSFLLEDQMKTLDVSLRLQGPPKSQTFSLEPPDSNWDSGVQ